MRALCGRLWRAYRRLVAQRRMWVRERTDLRTQLEAARKRAEQAEELGRKLRAQVAEHARQRFGDRSESRRPGSGSAAGSQEPSEAEAGAAGGRGKKGQRPGVKGHGRRRGRHGDLPVEEVLHAVAETERRCQNCGRERQALAPQSSDELDIELIVRLRRHIRECYVSRCDCWKQGLSPKFVRGATPDKLIPRGGLSTRAIAFLVTARYMWGLPLHRLTGILHGFEADVPDGTVVGIFAALLPLLAPLDAAVRARNVESPYLHADETTWRMLWAGKRKRGWLWCFVGRDTVVYVFDAGRGHKVVLDYLGLNGTGWGGHAVELICDFMAAYDKAARLANAQQRRLELNRCWVHLRRLFLKLGAQHPTDRRLAGQIAQWLAGIADLCEIHHERDTAADGSPEQQEAQCAFLGCLAEMEALRQGQLDQAQLAPGLRQLLSSTDEHWAELTRCAADPHRPPHNNTGERNIRHPVIIRKNAFGSGSAVQARIACLIWTIGKTAERNGINPHRLFADYLDACTAAGGAVPANWRDFLPCPPPSTLAAQPADGASTPPVERDGLEAVAPGDPGRGAPQAQDTSPSVAASAPEAAPSADGAPTPPVERDGPEAAAPGDPDRGAPQAQAAPTPVPVAADAPQAAQCPPGFGAGRRPAPGIAPTPTTAGTLPPAIAWPPEGKTIASPHPPDSRVPGRRRHGPQPRTARPAARRVTPGGRAPAGASTRPP